MSQQAGQSVNKDALLGKKSMRISFEKEDKQNGESSLPDIALFYLNGTFYAIDAVCPHAGGPLELGDIEDWSQIECEASSSSSVDSADCNSESANSIMKPPPCVTCPEHLFVFDLTTGKSMTTGYKTNVHDVMLVGDTIYVDTTRSPA